MFNLKEIPQSELVSVDEIGKATTTSLKIAELFNKRHADVLRDIEQILTQVTDSFHQRNFAFMQNEVKIGNGAIRKDPAYQLTEAGFSIVVMGYTGSKAMQFKELFITEFMNMREFIDTKRSEYEQFLETKNNQLSNKLIATKNELVSTNNELNQTASFARQVCDDYESLLKQVRPHQLPNWLR